VILNNLKLQKRYMKKYFIQLLLMVPVLAVAQAGDFSLKGKVEDLGATAHRMPGQSKTEQSSISEGIKKTNAEKYEKPAGNAGAELPPITVRGRILNEKGEPVSAVTVAVKDTRKATTTNANGEFELKGVDDNATLVISHVNIDSYEVKVDGKAYHAVSVKTKFTDLEDVVVTANTGYQLISKERATGSFNVIGKEQLGKPTINIASRLIGTTAGMQARLDVDGNPVFEIRGLSSLNPATANPLVVVDGFPIQGDFNSVNPNDVESVTVLKDAAAASIWGARSANGVIVVTTRNARKGVPLKVEFSAFTRFGKKFDLDYVRPLASSAETVEYEKMAFNKWSAQINSGALSTNYGKQWSAATVALSEQNLGFITAAERDAILARLSTQDNRSQISKNLLANPVNRQYNLSLFGSSERMMNALSLLYEDNQSNFKETDSRRYMINYRTASDVVRWMSFHFSGMLQHNKINNNGVSLGDIQGMSPYEMLVNPDNSLANISMYYWPIMERSVPMHLFSYADWTYNPIQEIANRDITVKQLNARLQGGLTFRLFKGLSFDSKIQYELFNTANRSLYNENTFNVRSKVNIASTWDPATNKITLNLPKGSILDQSRAQAQTYNFRNQLNFNRTFANKHEISFVGGSEINNVVTETVSNPTTYGYNDNTLTVGTFPNGPGGTFAVLKNWMGSNQTFGYTNSYSYRTEKYFSVFGNAAYTLNRKYTVSGSYRTDASNLITDDPKYRFDPFWSVGLGWQVYKEDFMSNIGWLDQLNVRATYGYNGNVDRSTSFRPLISAGGIPNTYTGDFTASVSSFGNPTLRWEKTGTWNLGLDYSVFRGKLYGKVDVYNKQGKDLIAQLSIPAVNGTTSQKLNNAEMVNRGIELELGSALRIRGDAIKWRGSVNFSYNKNKITNLFVANYPASTLYAGGSGAYVEGENANSLWRFEYAGVKNTQPMVKGAEGGLYDFGAFTPGDGRKYMLNMGTTVAPYTLGLINSFQVHDFNLSFIITGKFGHVFQRQGFNYPPTWTSRVLPNNKLSEVMNGDPMKIVPLPMNDIEPRYYFWDRFHQYLSYLIEDASHVRMQEVNLTYSLPHSLLSRFKMNRLQVYAQGNDLFTILANDAGEDPEYMLGTMKPQPKLTFGLKCEF
jgi:TonB-dependent starch-binding outer membrane protein SusC